MTQLLNVFLSIPIFYTIIICIVYTSFSIYINPSNGKDVDELVQIVFSGTDYCQIISALRRQAEYYFNINSRIVVLEATVCSPLKPFLHGTQSGFDPE